MKGVKDIPTCGYTHTYIYINTFTITDKSVSLLESITVERSWLLGLWDHPTCHPGVWSWLSDAWDRWGSRISFRVAESPT